MVRGPTRVIVGDGDVGFGARRLVLKLNVATWPVLAMLDDEVIAD